MHMHTAARNSTEKSVAEQATFHSPNFHEGMAVPGTYMLAHAAPLHFSNSLKMAGVQDVISV